MEWIEPYQAKVKNLLMWQSGTPSVPSETLPLRAIDRGTWLRRSDLLSSIYLTMLRDWPFQDIIRFWRRHPLGEMVSVASGSSGFFRQIVQENRMVPNRYLRNVLDDLEPFLVESSRSADPFFAELVFRNNSGSPVPASHMLLWLNRFMKLTTGMGGDRWNVLELMANVCGFFHPGSFRRNLRVDQEGEWRIAHACYSPDDSFAGEDEHDCELFHVNLIRQAPRVFGLPAFEDVSLAAHRCGIAKMLRYAEPAFEGGCLVLHGIIHGRKIGFHEYARALGLDIERHGVPDREVVLVTRDYSCPLRRRTVLRKGCVYGAPVYLESIRYLHSVQSSSHPLEHLIQDLHDPPLKDGSFLRQRHEEFLRALDHRVVFTYFSHDESIAVNGRHLVRSIPAKILLKVLRTYLHEGRSLFEFREFKRDGSIAPNPKNSGFEVRLRRLQASMRAVVPSVGVRLHGSGTFSLVPEAGIDLLEV